MRISIARAALILLLASLVGACANDKNEQEKELTQMRMEIEQLTNALGRLEFRVYELENQQGAVESGNDQAGITKNDAPATEATPPAEAAPEKSAQRFDLAPVE